MTGVRDRQRSKVYAWEERFVAPRDQSSIAFAQAQGMVDAIWTEMGLLFPPKVEPLPRQARSMVADANRLSIRLPDASPSWWLLHELAHAMTSANDGRSDGHGPKFIGLYAQLLTRYLRIPSDALLTSLRVAGIEMDTRAVPISLTAHRDASLRQLTRTFGCLQQRAAARGEALAGDAYVQTQNILGTIRRVLEQAGARVEDVVRTVIYLTDIDDAASVGRAHREVLGDVRPASTMVQVVALVRPEMRVEIEAYAVIDAAK